MKKLVVFLFLVLSVFSGAFLAARWVVERHSSAALAKAGSSLGQSFFPNPYTLKNQSFVIVIVGHNNGSSLSKTIESVFSQNYEHYRVVYIDDASDDGSFDLARDLIYDSKHMAEVTLARNEERLGVLANIYRAIQDCRDEEILVVVGGEDWLAHEWVLQRLNTYYSDPDLWLTYGQYREFPHFQMGCCREFRSADLQDNGFREHPFISSHLQTFYAGLFKKVREADFIYEGKFLSCNAEMAYMIPMLEMAKDHFQFIPEILYISNTENIRKEDKELLMRTERHIRTLSAYTGLSSLPKELESETF